MVDLIMRFPRLENLNLSGCYLSFDQINEINNKLSEFTNKISKKRPVNVSLDLKSTYQTAKRSCLLVPSKQNVFCDNIFFLSKLYLASCHITNIQLEHIAQLYPYLKEFDISNNTKITNLSPILLNCVNLNFLSISGCPVQSNNSQLVGKRFLQNLESLLFSGPGFLDYGFIDWFEASKKTLKELRLAQKTIPNENIGKENFINQIVSVCTEIKFLDICGVNIDPNFIKNLDPNFTQNCQELGIIYPNNLLDSNKLSFPGLKTLRLSSSTVIEIKKSPQLRQLVLFDDKKALLQVEIAKILTRVPLLESLEIWNCSSISFSLLTTIGYLCPNLYSCILSISSLKQNSLQLVSIKDSIKPLTVLNQLQIQFIQIKFPNIEWKLLSQSKNHFFINIKSNRNNTYKINHFSLKLNSEKLFSKIYIDGVSHWNLKKLNLESILLLGTKKFGLLPFSSLLEGILFYEDSNFVYWETYGSEPKKNFIFYKSQYSKALLYLLRKKGFEKN